MKTFGLIVLLMFWLLMTMILTCSVIGLLLLCPVLNNTNYHMNMTDDRRSTWMLIGLHIKDKLLERYECD